VLTRVLALSAVPVGVLSARHDSDDRVTALDLGADDYCPMPASVIRCRGLLGLPAEGGPGLAPPGLPDYEPVGRRRCFAFV
jgi:DNA-binding NarL/FixJ family response regulator